MKESNLNASDSIYIRETIGGVATKADASTEKGKKNSRSRKEAVVTTLKSDPYIWGIYLMLVLIYVIDLYSA